jgi:hypothetical protein
MLNCLILHQKKIIFIYKMLFSKDLGDWVKLCLSLGIPIF